MLRKLVLALPLFFGLQATVHAHSDASMFGAPSAGGEHHDHPVEAAVRYPATLTFDPRQLTNVVIKINARITKLNNLFVGKRVARNEILGEMESAELETIQSTYLGLYSNMEAVRGISITGNEKLIDARMGLQWRGMSEDDIKLLENRREPLKDIRIKSPAAGFIYGLNVVNNQILNTGGQVGQYTATGTTILTIARPSAIQVEASLPIREASKLKPGQRATVYLADIRRGQVEVPAVVQQVFAFANPVNQRQRVRLKLTAQPPSGMALPTGLQTSVSLGEPDHAH
ncbi:MAG: HlyD family secretion protein [Hydrogenophilales bacterium 16-64-46]|nr:MAG: HlyD family secretion protein [Hydrogenophilales bacterium 16-64-46]OZA38560.1 MAG: HlyD family secretion protein [Hydrogenophilales bacterium 17-64-34]HQT00216.1 efflux RND transporter periplasmic adaptor subunit [Thiobacillus sp.]